MVRGGRMRGSEKTHTWTNKIINRTTMNGEVGAWMTPSLTVAMTGMKTMDSLYTEQSPELLGKQLRHRVAQEHFPGVKVMRFGLRLSQWAANRLEVHARL